MTDSAPPRTPARRIAAGLAGLLLVGLTFTGTSGFFNEWSQTRGSGQAVQTFTQLIYGVGAALSLVTTVWARRWSRVAHVGFAAGLTLSAGLAPVVWGEAEIWTGFVTGAAALATALGIVWILRWGFAEPARPLRKSGLP